MEQSNLVQPIPAPPPLKQRTGWSNYFSFRSMITFSIIQFVYVLVAIIITIAGIAIIFHSESVYNEFGSNNFSFMPSGPVAGILILIVGNIFWRMWCELILVLFRINKTLNNIEDNTGDKSYLPGS